MARCEDDMHGALCHLGVGTLRHWLREERRALATCLRHQVHSSLRHNKPCRVPSGSNTREIGG